MSRRFNFDDFDQQVAEALEEADRHALDHRMAIEGAENELRKRWPYPGEIGGVAVTTLFGEPIYGEYPPLPPEGYDVR